MTEPLNVLYDQIIYEDDNCTVFWQCDENGDNIWFEIAGEGLTPGVKDAAYVAALASIGEKFLKYSMEEDMFTDLRSNREP